MTVRVPGQIDLSSQKVIGVHFGFCFVRLWRTRPYISLHGAAHVWYFFFYTRATQRWLCPGWSHISSLFSPAKRYCCSSAHALCLYYFLGVGSFSVALWQQHQQSTARLFSAAHGGRQGALPSPMLIFARDDVIFHIKKRKWWELSRAGNVGSRKMLLCSARQIFYFTPDDTHQPDK